MTAEPLHRLAMLHLVLAAWVLWASCGGEEATGPSFWTAELTPEVLVEEGRVAVPVGAPLAAEVGATRFLAGWVPWLHEGRPVMAAGRDGARVQVVHLRDRQRTLYLDLVEEDGTAADEHTALTDAAPDGTGFTVRVSAVGRPPSWTEIEDVAWGDPVEIPLPEGLSPGRLLVEVVRAPGSPPLDVAAAQLRPNLPPGEARFSDGDGEGKNLVQSGWSRVEAVRRVAPGEAVHGTFRPPDDPGEGQVFRAVVEDGRGVELSRFEWRQGQPRWSRDLRLSTGDADGMVRLVLTAEGSGPAATWEGLRWRDLRPAEVATAGGGDTGPASGGKRASAPGTGGEASAEPPRLVMVYVMDALRADHVAASRRAGTGDGEEGPDAADGPPPLARTTAFDLRRNPETSATFDRLAADGVVFTAHRSVAPSTLPSTRALFTGRLQPEAADAGEAVMLAEHFREAGYRTALFSGNPYVGPAYGLDRGFDHVAEGVLYEEDPSAPFNDNAARVHAAALDWLEALPAGERAFVYIHTIHPHNPYDPPRDLARGFTRRIHGSAIDGSTDTLFAVQRRRRPVTGADRARLAALYAGAFAYNDRELAAFLDGVAEHVPPDDTFLTLTSDHGEELFDHGGVLHGYTLYEEQLRVPLVLWAPGWLTSGHVTAPTTTLDLRAALLSLLPSNHQPPGDAAHNLLAPLPDPATRPLFAAAPSVRDGLVSLSLGDLKLVAAPGGPRVWGMGLGLGRTRDPEYVFDLAHDPHERQNRAGLEGIGEDWLRSRLRAWVPTRRPTGPEPPTDPETRKKLEALGYLR